MVTDKSLDFNNSDHLNALLLAEARRILHLPNWRIQRTRNGFYTQSRSAEVFQHPPDPRIRLVTGIGGKGMTAAAGFAQHHVAQLGLG